MTRGSVRNRLLPLKRTYVSIYEECIDTLRLRAMHIQRVEETLPACGHQDDDANFDEVFGTMAQHWLQLQIAEQDLIAVLETQRRLFGTPKVKR